MSSRREPWAVAAAAFLAFLPALANGFVDWDDAANFASNPHYRGLGWEQLRWMFTTFHASHYQPLSWLTLGLDHALWGMRPFGYHLTSLLLHSANAALFWSVLRRLALPREAALLGALFFAVHPLRAESVVWATERRDVLAGFFFLIAIREHIDGRPRRALAAHAAALLSKVTALTLPAVLLVIDVLLLRRPARASAKRLAPFFLLSLVFTGVGLAAQASKTALVALGEFGAVDRALQALYGLWFYVWKTAVPLGLSPWYGASVAEQAWYGAGAAAGAGLIAAAAVLGRRRPWLWAAALAYAAMVFPALGVVKSGRQIVADRYSYLSCLPWAALAGIGLARLPRRGAVLALALLAALSWRQSAVWKDSVSLWSRALEITPRSSTAILNLGTALMKEGRPEEALAHVEAQLGLEPFGALEWELRKLAGVICNNRGVDLALAGRTEEAFLWWRRGLEWEPASPALESNVRAAAKGESGGLVKYDLELSAGSR